jgi:tripartite-type tricarboxylate transporter receptor subunit TctC
MGVGIKFAQWAGLFVPSGTSDAITNRLRDAAKVASTDEKVRSVINAAGSPIQYLDAPEFQSYWDADAKQMQEAVRVRAPAQLSL